MRVVRRGKSKPFRRKKDTYTHTLSLSLSLSVCLSHTYTQKKDKNERKSSNSFCQLQMVLVKVSFAVEASERNPSSAPSKREGRFVLKKQCSADFILNVDSNVCLCVCDS